MIAKWTYVVAGDVFWWSEGQKQEVDINTPDNDPGHMDQPELIKSRKKVLEMGDWIISGHGKMFMNEKID